MANAILYVRGPTSRTNALPDTLLPDMVTPDEITQRVKMRMKLRE